MLSLAMDRLNLLAVLAALCTVVFSYVIYDSWLLRGFSVLLAVFMILITISDIRFFLIPDWLSLPLIPAGILFSYLTAPGHIKIELTLFSAVAAFFGFGVLYLLRSLYRSVRKRHGLGLGDVKLAAVAGAWTGVAGLNMVLLLSSVLALFVILLIYLSGHKIKRTTAIPFGAFLAPAIWVTWSLQQTGVANGFLL